METLSFYLDTATKAIYKWGPAGMRSDEDAISDVASEIMKADGDFDGRGSLSGYRMYRARCAILNLIRAYKRRVPTYSLDYKMDNPDSDDALNYNTLVVEEVNHNMEEIIDNAPISERQKYCITRYYIFGETFEEIGRAIGYSGEQCRKDVYSALPILRDYYRSQTGTDSF